jgi:hypothetical protein
MSMEAAVAEYKGSNAHGHGGGGVVLGIRNFGVHHGR